MTDVQDKVIEGEVGENLSIIPTVVPDVTLDVFAGLAEAPVTQKQAEILTAPADPNELDILPTGEVYPPQIKVRGRLMKAFGPAGWGMRPLGSAKIKDNQVVQEWALYANGRYISYSMGGAEYQATNARMNWSDAVESEKSNALVRLGKDLGMFPECWDSRYTAEWRQKYAVRVWRKDVKKPEWRRLDAAPFWNETGITDDSPNRDKYQPPKNAQKPTQPTTRPTPPATVKPADNGTQPHKPEPVAPVPPTPVPTPAPEPDRTPSASKMLVVSSENPKSVSELDEALGRPSITAQEAQKVEAEVQKEVAKNTNIVKIWDGEKWMEKPADERISMKSASWFTSHFVGKEQTVGVVNKDTGKMEYRTKDGTKSDRAFSNTYALFGNPPKSIGHLGKHYGRQNFVNPKDANDALTYREFSELVAYAWWKQGDKEHGTLSLPRYQDKLTEELNKQPAVSYDEPHSVIDANDILALAGKLGVDILTLAQTAFTFEKVPTLDKADARQLQSLRDVLELVNQGKLKPDDQDGQLEMIMMG